MAGQPISLKKERRFLQALWVANAAAMRGEVPRRTGPSPFQTLGFARGSAYFAPLQAKQEHIVLAVHSAIR